MISSEILGSGKEMGGAEESVKRYKLWRPSPLDNQCTLIFQPGFARVCQGRYAGVCQGRVAFCRASINTSETSSKGSIDSRSKRNKRSRRNREQQEQA